MKQYAVLMSVDPDVIHRGPYETLEEAQSWIDETVEMGAPEDLFVLVSRTVSQWEPLNVS